MRTIWKFPLEVEDVQHVFMPAGAEILTVQVQSGLCVMWAICDPGAHQVRRLIRIAGTGHPAPEGKYIGTCQDGLGLVWHVFDGGTP